MMRRIVVTLQNSHAEQESRIKSILSYKEAANLNSGSGVIFFFIRDPDFEYMHKMLFGLGFHHKRFYMLKFRVFYFLLFGRISHKIRGQKCPYKMKIKTDPLGILINSLKL